APTRRLDPGCLPGRLTPPGPALASHSQAAVRLVLGANTAYFRSLLTIGGELYARVNDSPGSSHTVTFDPAKLPARPSFVMSVTVAPRTYTASRARSHPAPATRSRCCSKRCPWRRVGRQPSDRFHLPRSRSTASPRCGGARPAGPSFDRRRGFRSASRE